MKILLVLLIIMLVICQGLAGSTDTSGDANAGGGSTGVADGAGDVDSHPGKGNRHPLEFWLILRFSSLCSGARVCDVCAHCVVCGGD